MPSTMLLVAVACCCWAGALPSALAAVIKVESGKDGSSGSCPGATCNLRAAWGSAKLGDTILLEADPVMSAGELPSPAWLTTSQNGSVTLMGPTAGGAVIHGGTDRLIVIAYFPNTETQKVKLVLKNIEFSGFDVSDTKGTVICLSGDGWCGESLSQSPSPMAQRASAGRKQAATSHPALLGEEQTKYGNWSQLRKGAMMEVSNCVFRNNVRTATSDSYIYGGVVQVNAGDSPTPLYFVSTEFIDNVAKGTVVVASAIATVSSSTGVPVMISKCTFANNLQEGDSCGIIDSVAGSVVGGFGPISIYGSSFVGNTLGPVRAAVTTSLDSDHTDHVYIYDTTFLQNGGNSMSANSDAAAIISGWVVLHKVNLELPASVPPTATMSPNDQYMHQCAISSVTGKGVTINGYQIYNRNPIFTNLINGTAAGGGGGVGFADCAEGAGWLPCRKGTTCTTLQNSASVAVGYSCQ